MLGHPSNKALRAWLRGESDPKVDAHVESCERCAASLEALETNGDADGAIGEALRAVLSPPAGLSDRLTRKVAARLDSKVMFEIISDIFGAGLETSRLMLTEENP